MDYYIGKKMIVDTRYADGGVYFEEEYFEFKPRNQASNVYIKIFYNDIDHLERYRGIKHTVIVELKDGQRIPFYMYKMNTFVDFINQGILKNKGGETIDKTVEEPKTQKEMSNEDIDKLSKLNELHKQGVLSDEDYQKQKDLILNRYK